MQVEHLGEGQPEVAIVGAIHGDEPCGVAVIEHLLAERPPVERPVALIVANERALEAGERYIDHDLNRAFPGEGAADSHERRLAADLRDVLSGCETLSLHSTQSYDDSFAIVNSPGEFEREVVPRLSIDAIVDASGFEGGRFFESVSAVVEVECGYQGSDEAAANGIQMAREFLGAVGALPDHRQPIEPDLPVYRLTEHIPKEDADSYEVYASNFEAVAVGEQFAAADDRPVVAEEAFYPVLMSADGYESVFGFAAEHVGPADEVL